MMVDVADGWPERSDVDQAWREVLAGVRSRESVQAWSAPWVEGDLSVGPASDVMVSNGLQYLHGLGLSTRGEDGLRRYMFDDAEAHRRYEDWLARCADYDQDPEGWLQRQRDLARARIAAERD
jgi:hypothetical protein